MSRSRAVSCFLCFILFFGVLGGLVGDQVALAAEEGSGGSFLMPLNQEQPPPEEKLEISCLYPALRDISGNPFAFEVELKWHGSQSKRFNLAASAPPRWTALIVEGTSGREVPAIELVPENTYAIYVALMPLTNELPEPGNYVVTFEARSDDINETLELMAVVTAKYLFAFYTENEQLNIEVTAGEENHLSLMIANTGTAKIEDITLNSSEPYGWTITFNPEEISSIEAGLVRTVDAVIKPPRKVIAGDYMITMQAIVSKGLIPTKELQIRVTVLTPTVWGWVGILIVLAVIAGLGVMFRRLGRR